MVTIILLLEFPVNLISFACFIRAEKSFSSVSLVSASLALASVLRNFRVFDMGETRELQLQVMGYEAKEENSGEPDAGHQSTEPQVRGRIWWIQMGVYSFFLLSGQTVATLLGRLYFDKGGNSKWMSTFVQLAGFPLLLPFYCISLPKNPTTDSIHMDRPPALTFALLYVSLGILLAGDCLLYSYGLSYLPVSTYSLICASQLGFNALFSFFLNAQKFTPFIVNSLVLLTISSALLVFQTDDSSDSKKISKEKYITGFLCTLLASAGYALLISLTQLAFRKIIKRNTMRAMLDLIIYQSIVATCVAVAGLFASGEWKDLKKEMEGYELGKISYLMTLIWTAAGWDVFSIGAVGLIFDVSSLFSNVISTLGLPIIPVLALVFFHDKLDGVKVIAMLLAVWGFVSYMYQHYLDDSKSKAESANVDQVSQASTSKEVDR